MKELPMSIVHRSDDLNDAIQEIASGSAEIIFLGEEIVEQEIIK